jgi:hypothetical protein
MMMIQAKALMDLLTQMKFKVILKKELILSDREDLRKQMIKERKIK